jgi:DNA modification methylase
LSTGLIIKQRIVWNKSHWKMGDLSYYGSQTEDILFTIKSRQHQMRWAKREGNLWSSSSSAYLPEGQYDHPTQKPEAIIARMIYNSSLPGDIILDLHCGSGTVPTVARRLGRRWLACDIRAKYTQMTRQRVRDTQPPLFVPQPYQMALETGD